MGAAHQQCSNAGRRGLEGALISYLLDHPTDERSPPTSRTDLSPDLEPELELEFEVSPVPVVQWCTGGGGSVWSRGFGGEREERERRVEYQAWMDFAAELGSHFSRSASVESSFVLRSWSNLSAYIPIRPLPPPSSSPKQHPFNLDPDRTGRFCTLLH